MSCKSAASAIWSISLSCRAIKWRKIITNNKLTNITTATMLMLIIMRLSSTGYSGAAALASSCEPVPSVRVDSGALGSRMPGVAYAVATALQT